MVAVLGIDVQLSSDNTTETCKPAASDNEDRTLGAIVMRASSTSNAVQLVDTRLLSVAKVFYQIRQRTKFLDFHVVWLSDSFMSHRW